MICGLTLEQTRRVLITGGDSGLGFSIAWAFAARNAQAGDIDEMFFREAWRIIVDICWYVFFF